MSLNTIPRVSYQLAFDDNNSPILKIFVNQKFVDEIYLPVTDKSPISRAQLTAWVQNLNTQET